MKRQAARAPESEALTNIFLETFRLNGRLLAAGDKLIKDLGLSSSKWQVLGAIESSGRPLTVPQIARTMGLTRQGVQRTVTVLAEQGLVELRDNPNHLRSSLVALAPGAAQVLREVDRRQAKWSAALAEGLSLRDLNLVGQSLRELRTRVEAREKSNK